MKKTHANRYSVFISSVQKEFAAERRALKDFITHDPLLNRFFLGVFLFEDISARDRKPDDIYLNEVEGCDIYRTASRDLEDLVSKGVLRKVGLTGRNVHYVLSHKQDINRTNRTNRT